METSVLPHSMDAEQALLGCVLYDNAAFERAGDAIRAEHFFDPTHQRLFATVEELIRKGRLADPLTVRDRLGEDAGLKELGGTPFLADLVYHAPPAAHAADYARVIRDLALRRELIRLGGEMIKDAQGGECSAPDQVERAESALFSIVERGQRVGGSKSFDQVLTGAVEAAARAYDRDGGLTGLSSGLHDLDALLGGLNSPDLIILAARPSQGKSALAMNAAFHVARHYAYEQLPNGGRRTTAGGIVQFFSLEMSAEQLGMRILAEVSGVPSDRIRKGQIEAHEFSQIRDAALEIQSAPLFVDDTGGISLAQLCARARRQKRTTGLDLIVVDYLQLVTTPGAWSDNRVQQVSEVSATLKALAKELNVPVLALAQLSRQVESRENKKPQLSDLRESGSLEQDADVVMFLFREAYYLGRSEPRPGTPEHVAWQDRMDAVRSEAEVIIGKQRHGPIGTVRLHFNESLTKFSDRARESSFGEPRRAQQQPTEGQRRIVFSGAADD